MNDSPQEGVPRVPALGNGTVGQPQITPPSLKVLAARVLEGVRENVPLSHTLGWGHMGQSATSPASRDNERAAEWDAEDWQAHFD